MTNPELTPQIPSASTSEAMSQLGNLLEEYGEIATILPVLAGLFITSRLQLRGVQALLTNLAIAAVTRQAVIQLKKQAHQTPGNGAPSNSQSSEQESAQAAEDYTIVHSTFGRIRLRIPRLIGDAAYAKRLENLLSADERVTGVRVNRAAASLIVQYDGAGVSELELGMRLLQILDQAEKGSQPDQVHTTAES